MWRSLAVITAAIQLSGPPSMSKSTAARYAKVVQEEAATRSFDPFSLVSIVRSESRWNPTVVNSVNCVGLGQICLSNYSYCRTDISSAQCQAQKRRLLDGEYNLREAAKIIDKNRRMCRKKTGKPGHIRYWLPSYGGWNVPSRNIWCGQQLQRGVWRDLPLPRAVRKTLAYRELLSRKRW